MIPDGIEHAVLPTADAFCRRLLGQAKLVSLDDSQIMQQVQNGQIDRFEELVLRYREPLVRVAWSKLGDQTWAEDVVQETFMAVFSARHSYRPELPFRTWLWTILLNLCRRQWKRRMTRPQESAFDVLKPGHSSEPATDDGGLQRLLTTERSEQLMALLDDLPEPQADALRLRFFGGLKFEEIARTMDCSLSGAKRRVQTGLLKLAERLRALEGESS